MPAYAVTGVVLRTYKLGEADRIVVILAEDGRQVRAVAKGSRKTTSRLAGRMRPYVVSRLLIATGRSLDVISEAEVIESHEALALDLDRGAGAGAVCELAERLSSDGDPEPRIYALTAATLDALADVPPEAAQTLTAAYYAKALSMHGWRPQLGTCVACGAEVPATGYLSAAEGGVLCPACAGTDPLAPAVDPAMRRLLGDLISSTLAELAVRDPDPERVRTALLLLRDFATYHMGGRLRAIDFLLGLSE